ncbi:serine/threonine protein phosphatase [Cellulophaga sp. HaHaR_3_176]|uniref:metallophosphoesterase family protein n=1 Tax=Cellulophaga sp. HaHaR_3_176 TaxID=1942464 RepID=UPI001C1F359F|nr:metallophosphoesterase family protein [Cellulophaga sp. HaHaR_3_176]QWX83425.1 serine/threonine protein phosphatase [Cellulophaga sp. HaHaR_3_176]
MKRTLVIGDIHSGLKALEQLLERAEVTKNDHLIFLGDYVDGWSQAVETIDFLIELNKKHKCTFIRGNHDEFCKSWLLKEGDNPEWFKHGGEATINSYAKADKQTIDNHVQFYEGLNNYYLDDNDRLFLHAGFTNLKGIEFEYFKKTFYWDRTLWEMALSLNPNLKEDDILYPKRLKNYKEIYIGHTPVTRIGKTEPQNAANVWNIDTGAAFKGPLSILDVETKKVWQSDPVYTFYPDETGRN